MPLREVRDDGRRIWTVWDTYPTSSRRLNVRPGFQAGWLTFECEGEKYRLHPIPAGWVEASDLKLLGYLTAAERIRTR